MSCKQPALLQAAPRAKVSQPRCPVRAPTWDTAATVSLPGKVCQAGVLARCSRGFLAWPPRNPTRLRLVSIKETRGPNQGVTLGWLSDMPFGACRTVANHGYTPRRRTEAVGQEGPPRLAGVPWRESTFHRRHGRRWCCYVCRVQRGGVPREGTQAGYPPVLGPHAQYRRYRKVP